MRSHEKMEDSEFERLLIQSARLDHRSAPPAVRRRILAAVHPFVGAAGTAGALTASRALASTAPSALAASATASLKLLGPALIIKCTLCGLLGGAAIAGGYRMATSPSVSPGAHLTSTIASRLPKHVALPLVARDRSGASPTVEASPPQHPRPALVASASQAAAMSPPVNTLLVGAEPSRSLELGATKRGSFALGAEVAMLDRARAALASGDGALAIRMLDDYQKSFRSGHLLPEANYIRVQALLKMGKQAAARDAAAHAQAIWPDSPLSKELGTLVKSSAGP